MMRLANAGPTPGNCSSSAWVAVFKLTRRCLSTSSGCVRFGVRCGDAGRGNWIPELADGDRGGNVGLGLAESGLDVVTTDVV